MKKFTISSVIFLMAIGLIFISCEDDKSPTDPGDQNGGSGLSIPDSLMVTALSESVIQISWYNSDNSVVGYRIHRMSNDSDWVQITEIADQAIILFNDANLNEGTQYSYKIKSYSARSESDFSSEVSATTFPIGPDSLRVARVSATELLITWSDNSSVETGYELQRGGSNNDDDLETIQILGPDSETFSDDNLQPDSTYFYRVRAQIEGLNSAWSSIQNGETSVYTPKAPTELVVEPRSPSELFAIWNDRSSGLRTEDGFVVEISSDNETFIPVDSLVRDRNQTFIRDLEMNTTYWVRVYAYNEHGTSDFSEIVEAATPDGPPIEPSEFVATAPDFENVILNWHDNATNETGFIIQRLISGTSIWSEPMLVEEANAASYTDTSVVRSTTYNYRIAAYNDIDQSMWVESENVRVPDGPPLAPYAVVVTGEGIDKIRVNWRNRPPTPDGYIVWRSLLEEDNFRRVGTVENTLFRDDGLETDTWYQYKIQAFRGAEVSDFSMIDSAKTWSLIVLFDDFESYEINLPPDNPAYSPIVSGNSWIRVSNQDSYNGAKSIKFYDGINQENDYAQLFTNHRPLAKGKLSCALKIANGGYFGIIGAGYMGTTRQDSIITFQLQFQPNDTFLVRDAGGLYSHVGYPNEEWTLFELEFDCNTHLYQYSFDGQAGGEFRLQNEALIENRYIIFIVYNDVSIDYVFIDDLQIEQVLPDEEFQTIPNFRGRGTAIGVSDMFDSMKILK